MRVFHKSRLVLRTNPYGWTDAHTHTQIPMISPTCSNDALSNKNSYPNFFRTMPANRFLAKAMAEFIAYYEWEYVSIIREDG